MRLWTIQPRAVWNQIQRDGVAIVDPFMREPDGYMPGCYRWLIEQLRQRIDGYKDHYPWWLYCAKPDLRLFRHTRRLGSKQVRLEIEPEPGTYLTFPTWAWDRIFSGRYIGRSVREHHVWDHRTYLFGLDHNCRLPRRIEKQIRASWRKLFNPRLPDRMGRWEERTGVIEFLKRDDVRDVTCFNGAQQNAGWYPTPGEQVHMSNNT